MSSNIFVFFDLTQDWEGVTLQETNISPKKWHFEDDFPFPQVGYVNFLEGSFMTPWSLEGSQL